MYVLSCRVIVLDGEEEPTGMNWLGKTSSESLGAQARDPEAPIGNMESQRGGIGPVSLWVLRREDLLTEGADG